MYARFDREHARGNLKTAWSHVLAIEDISYAMPRNVQESAALLASVWAQHSRNIASEDESSYQAIDKAIDEVKQDIVVTINQLR